MNKKLEVIISKAHKREQVSDSYKTPIINLSNIELILEESKQLSPGLEYSFVDKNKKFLAANFESIADKITDNLQSDQQESFHEFLRAYVDIFTKSVYTTTDYTYKHLKRIINDKIWQWFLVTRSHVLFLLIRPIIRVSYRKWLMMVLKMVFIM